MITGLSIVVMTVVLTQANVTPLAQAHAHNDYLNILAETGLVGLAGYLLGWAWIVWGTLRSLRHRDPLWRGLTLGLLGTWTHLAVHSTVDS